MISAEQQILTRNTRRKIVNSLVNQIDGLTRTEICKETGIPWTTTHDNLIKLLIDGRVKRKEKRNGRGRPTVIWSIN